MYTRLQRKLLSLLPLYDKSDDEKYKRLFAAANYLADVEGELTPDEADMARRFIARMVYDFMRNLEIKRAFEGRGEFFLQSSSTSFIEMGKVIEITEISPQDFTDATGFGPAFRNLSSNPVVRPHLDYVLQILWNGHYKEFLQLVKLDRYYGMSKWTLKRFLLTVVFFPIVVIFWAKMKIKPFISINLALSLRILLYATVSGKTWASAAQWALETSWIRHLDLSYIIIVSAFNLAETTHGLKPVREMIELFPWEQRYLLKGALGQWENKVVDELVDELPTASPPAGMRITNALILAAQRNPYAVKWFINVITNRDKYREAVEEILLVEKYLKPISLNALKALLEEAYALPSKKSDSYRMSRQSAARFLLKNAIGFEPDAVEYLFNVLETGQNVREIIVVVDALGNMLEKITDNKNHPVTFERLMVSACTLVQKTDILYAKVDDIDFDAVDPRVMAVKLALRIVLLAPLDIHQTLLLEIVTSLLACRDDIANKLQSVGVQESVAIRLAEDWLMGRNSDWPVLLDGNDTRAKTFLEVIRFTSNEVLALVFREFKKGGSDLLGDDARVRALLDFMDPTLNGVSALVFQVLKNSDPDKDRFYEVAEYLTRVFQSQIVATSALSSELSGYKTDIEWLQKRHSLSFSLLAEAPPTLENFVRANQYLQSVRDAMKRDIAHRIERRKKKVRDLGETYEF